LGRTDRACRCTPAMIAHYRSRVSGPLLDRFEIQVEVPPVPLKDLAKAAPEEPSAVVAARVVAARRRREHDIEPGLSASALRVLHQAIRRLGLSARAHDAILGVARTIAHLEGAASIEAQHVAEAAQYRTLDRECTQSVGR